jgi:hypothetical protein
MTGPMKDDIRHLGQFVEGLPLAAWNPTPIQLAFNEETMRGWGVSSVLGGLFWVQDFSQQGQGIAALRAADLTHPNTTVEIIGLPPSDYNIYPYDTHAGQFLDPISLTCEEGESCNLALPEFTADMAFKIINIQNEPGGITQ